MKRKIIIEDIFDEQSENKLDLLTILKRTGESITAGASGKYNSVKNSLKGIPNISINKLKYKMENTYQWFKESYKYAYQEMEKATSSININVPIYLLGASAIVISCYAAIKYLSIEANKKKIVDVKNIVANKLKNFIIEAKNIFIETYIKIKEMLGRIKFDISLDQIVGITVLMFIMSIIFNIYRTSISIKNFLGSIGGEIKSVGGILHHIGSLIVVCLVVLKTVFDIVFVILPATITVLLRAFWAILPRRN